MTAQCGVIGIFKKDFFSCAYFFNEFSEKFSGKVFIAFSRELNYGGCSSVAEHPTVARETRVRFSPSALFNIVQSRK